MDWGLYDFLTNVLVIAIGLPFMYLSWASGYLDIMFRQARTNHWLAPSMAQALGRKPPTPRAEWEREFGRNPGAYSPPKVKRAP